MRLLAAALLAIGAHLALFIIQIHWAPAALLTPQNRSVTISLVDTLPPAPAKALPRPAEKPRPKPKVKPKPKPVDLPEPEAMVLPHAEPTPPENIQETTLEKTSVDEDQPPADTQSSQAPSRPQGATIQSSVPRYDINPKPVYPLMALRRGYQGTVMLEVLVTREGRAGQVKVQQSSGYDMLDRKAVATVQQWLFTPALRGTQAVEMRVIVPVVFQLK
jgi:periplasmic protein TonB